MESPEGDGHHEPRLLKSAVVAVSAVARAGLWWLKLHTLCCPGNPASSRAAASGGSCIPLAVLAVQRLCLLATLPAKLPYDAASGAGLLGQQQAVPCSKGLCCTAPVKYACLFRLTSSTAKATTASRTSPSTAPSTIAAVWAADVGCASAEKAGPKHNLTSM
jgi:hypothetical protein